MKLFRVFALMGLAAVATGCPAQVGTVCGNGDVQEGEQCDDGNQADHDGCSASCQIEQLGCGNGRIETGELCDDGNQLSGDGCSSVCKPESGAMCGNGSVEAGERCDDGNADNTDDCLASCIPARCGDGNLRAGAEQCDSGAANSDTQPNACRTSCMSARCGDGVKDVNQPLAETCDDGNAASNDGCSATCQREPRCGDMVIDRPGEVCDDGNTANGDGCDSTCHKEPRCGDMVIDSGETCDDGNAAPGDGCSMTCAIEAGHQYETEPNGTYQTATLVAGGVQVHGAIEVGGDQDYYKIVLPAAADVRIEISDGTGLPNCASTVDTTLYLYDQNGTTSLVIDYDDGVNYCSLIDPSIDTRARGLVAGTYYIRVAGYLSSTVIPAYRVHISFPAVCGNGTRESTEVCDDSNTANGDGCDLNCKLEPQCGNGVKEGLEQCDDNNRSNGDGCSATCQYEVVAEVESNDSAATATPATSFDVLYRGAISPAADVDFFAITLTAAADLRIETSDAMGPGTCALIDTIIELRGPDGTLVLATDDEDGVGSCSKIDSLTDPGAKNVAAGTYYVRVIDFLQDTPIASYHLKVTATAICGNGTVEGSEQCDDSNTVGGDACSDRCQWAPIAESEPNDDGAVMSGGGTTGNDFSSAAANGPYSADVLLAGALTVGDEDVYAITNTRTTAQTVTIQTYGAEGFNTCSVIDTYLHLRDAAGVSLRSDNDAGVGFCSLISSYSLAPGVTIYAHVFDFNDDAAISRYFLFVNFL